MPKSAVNSIAITHTPLSSKSWQQQLARSITNPMELLAQLEIDPALFPDCNRASDDFRIKLPVSYLDKIIPGDPQDPLLLQVMASGQELLGVGGFNQDPVGDLDAMAAPGLLHKYDGRVLLVTTGVCAVHCRYCFRRHFPYSDNQPARDDWQQALDYIRQDSSIIEVILSGGDPLVLSDNKLAELISRLDDIDHLQRLRIHTRLPVVVAERVTDRLINMLASSRLQTCMVIHANHPNEIQQAEITALHRLADAGITLLNQSVLLKNINDNTETLKQLSEKLYQARVLPYYLHMLDPVAGAAHFNVEKQLASQLMAELRNLLPGYLVPRLVREIAGEKSKIPVIGL